MGALHIIRRYLYVAYSFSCLFSSRKRKTIFKCALSIYSNHIPIAIRGQTHFFTLLNDEIKSLMTMFKFLYEFNSNLQRLTYI